MGELYADSNYPPWGIPADAVMVLRWTEGEHPERWEVVAMGSGFTALTDVRDALADQFPGLDGQDVLITNVGGNRARVKRITVQETVSRVVSDADPVAPA